MPTNNIPNVKIKTKSNKELLKKVANQIEAIKERSSTFDCSTREVLDDCLNELLKDRNRQCQEQLSEFIFNNAIPDIIPVVANIEFYFDKDTEALIKHIFELKTHSHN